MSLRAALFKLMGWMAPSRHLRAKMVSVESHHEQEPSMSEITTIGLDLAKSVFQVRGVNDVDGVATRKRLRRGQLLTFLLACRRAWLAGRPVQRRMYSSRELAGAGT